MEEDDDIDTSWIDCDPEQLQKEPMDSILCYFIYVGGDPSGNSVIQRVHTDRFELLLPEADGGIPYLAWDFILPIIQSRRQLASNVRYRLADVLLYNVDLDHIQSYSQNQEYVACSRSFLQVVPLLDEIRVPPSFVIFHELNCLYMIFQELPASLPRPILKSGGGGGGAGGGAGGGGGDGKRTKRVAFKELHLRHTKKRARVDLSGGEAVGLGLG